MSNFAAGEKLALDFHDFERDSEGYASLLLITDRATSYFWDYYLSDRRTETIIEALNGHINHLFRQHNKTVKAIECDNEIVTVKPRVKEHLERLAIRLEPSPPYTQALNGAGERSGGMVKEKIIAMRQSSKLPTALWKEICQAAVYLLNRTPRRQHNWRSPFELFHSRKPEIAHLRVYGYKAYAMTVSTLKKEQRLKRFNPKAWIGFLVGYASSNTYRIWNPLLNKIVTTRDVIFDEETLFDGNMESLRDDFAELDLEEIASMLRKYEPPPANLLPQSGELRAPSGRGSLLEAPLGPGAAEATSTPEKDSASSLASGEKLHTSARFELITPPPSPPAALLVAAMFGSAVCPLLPLSYRNHQHHCPGSQRSAEQRVQCEEWIRIERPERGQVERASNAAWSATRSGRLLEYPEVFRRGGAPGPSVSGPPTGSGMVPAKVEPVLAPLPEAELPGVSNSAADAWRGAFQAGVKASVVKGTALTKAQAMRRFAKRKRSQQQSPRVESISREEVRKRLARGDPIFRRELPAAPCRHSDLSSHPLGELFLKAEQDHLQSHREMRTWREIPAQDPRVKGHKILDCRWVYVYKFDKHGRFLKAKARLVVRGDQQARSLKEDNYAATLAGRSFRTLMAIAARFDLELIQYDAINAFVNAKLDETIFMRMPPGYKKPNTVLLLQKALYGLRRSPLLWQKELTKTLRELGFQPVPHEPCIFSRDGMLIFFYVDDIVFAYRKEQHAQALRTSIQLRQRYKLQGGEDLQWFLGIRVVRDRKKRLIWLSQAPYARKIASLADKKFAAKTPMTREELLPYEGTATKEETRRYLRKVGSLLYAAVITRPDIAFAVSRLARFTTNPGPEHQHAADRVLNYLDQHNGWALQLGGGDELRTASDSAFADNTLDRKSSQAYAIKLFGGLIG